ncbi:MULTISPECIES: protein kinase [unclassified Legionella]|uniref:protein kinase domain-containing protein n=1 Tax=unclassified Legionella TaxID=2622702 RepID=UPI0010557D6A|nr:MULTISPECIES: protein kinase [unclassified Legionella]MDI9817927.1 protein kinase [Legionella sp. PL877]
MKNASNTSDTPGIEEPGPMNVITPEGELLENAQVQQLEQIGKGTYGKIYKGLLNGQGVAIKETGESDENEIEIMCMLAKAHAPHVVHLIAYSLEDSCNRLYIQYMENNSLAKYIEDRQEPVNWSLRYRWIREITRGLAFLHQLNIVHLDIKSDNVLLDESLHAKIGDFGHAETMKGNKLISIKGTPLWVAPEVILGKPYDEKADIFSLAVTLWEIASWKLPEEPENFKSGTEDCHTTDEYNRKLWEYFSELKLKIPNHRQKIKEVCKPKLAKLITWGWQGEPENRPSAEELVKELETGIDTLSDNLSHRPPVNH